MKKVLIVIDMQNDFITGTLKNPEAEKTVPKIVNAVEKFDGLVLATRDTHGENYLDTPEGKALPVVHCVEGTWGWQLEQSIESAVLKKEHRFLDKPVFGNVVGWELDGYDEIELSGTCTDICVVSNALILKTLYPDAKITVHAELCSGLTPTLHEQALAVMKSCQILVD